MTRNSVRVGKWEVLGNFEWEICVDDTAWET
jgi:hypothetical protein